MNLKYITSICLLLSGLSAAAQQGTDTTSTLSGALETLNRSTPWLFTGNAAAMNIRSLPAIGSTYAGFNTEKGGFHRPQQPESKTDAFFRSERYQPLNNAFLYGSFSFTREWDNNIRMSDMLDPYHGTPYILGDSIGGDWKKQLYALSLKAASPRLAHDRLILGLGLQYNAGSGARQNDPRPLSTVNEITLRPGLVWEWNRNSRTGVNGIYGSYKEEVDLELKNTSVDQLLYKLKGPGIYEASIFQVSAGRNYNGRKYGAELQQEWNGRQWNVLLAAGYSRYSEDATDGSTKPRNAGRFTRNEYELKGFLQYHAPRYLHQLQLTWDQQDGAGREYHQRYESDKESWETVFSAVMTTSLITRADLTYQLMKTRGGNDYHWIAAAGVGFNGLDNRYLYPRYTQIADMLYYHAMAGWNKTFSRNSNLQLQANAAWYMRLTAKLDYTEQNLVAQQLLYPDHGYLTAERWQAAGSARYAFRASPAVPLQLYICAAGTITGRTGKVLPAAPGNHRGGFSLTIGAVY